MALDGFVISNIVYELNQTILNAKISKIAPEKSEIFLAVGHSPYHSRYIQTSPCKHVRSVYSRLALLIAYAHYIITLPIFTILFHKLCHLLSHGAQYQKLLSRNPVSQIKEPLILFLPPGSHHHKLKNPLS